LSPKQLGQTLRSLREDRGVTQVQLAKRAKVTQAYVAQLELGGKKNPSFAILKRLAKALGVPVTNLVG
jgi:transcriptional regulator with XRE-family HTH domain